MSILQAQKRLGDIERQVENLTQAQSDMVLRESLVMDALDAEAGYAPDEPELSSSVDQSGGQLFGVDDDQLSAFLALGSSSGFGGGMQQQTPQVCVPLVPMCSLSHRILTI